MGGLGNQMFQYAMGRHLALKNQTDLFFDTSFFSSKHNYAGCDTRFFSLDNFQIIGKIATKEQIKKLATNRYSKHFGLCKKTHVIEKHSFFQPEILELKGDYYFEGYWGLYKYFSAIQSTIGEDFTIKTELVGKNKEMAGKISDCNSISLHIRRGDYVSNPVNVKIYNTFGLEYYQRATEFIAKKVNNPHFFIFSDDMPWVKENLKLDFPITYVDQNSDSTNYEDIRLMSLCQHNIVANSSFSWWGAWLNNNPNKIIIAPKKLFNDPELSKNDVIPESWIRM